MSDQWRPDNDPDAWNEGGGNEVEQIGSIISEIGEIIKENDLPKEQIEETARRSLFGYFCWFRRANKIRMGLRHLFYRTFGIKIEYGIYGKKLGT